MLEQKIEAVIKDMTTSGIGQGFRCGCPWKRKNIGVREIKFGLERKFGWNVSPHAIRAVL